MREICRIKRGVDHRMSYRPASPYGQTFSFQALLFLAVLSRVSVRERRACWTSRPSAVLTAALACDLVVCALVATSGSPG